MTMNRADANLAQKISLNDENASRSVAKKKKKKRDKETINAGPLNFTRFFFSISLTPSGTNEESWHGHVEYVPSKSNEKKKTMQRTAN